MFSTFKSRLILGLYIFLILSIPVGAYLVSQNQTIKSRASEEKTSKPIVKFTPRPTTSGAKEILDSSLEDLSSSLDASPSSSEENSPTIATSFGPTLSLAASLEGRQVTNQATKLFVGIVEGAISSSPKFLLSFSVNLPKDGKYANLSLAGLSAGNTYTALLKGQAQIAAAASFTMSPTTTNLNEGKAVSMLTGDLNDDNVINSSDYTLAQKALGAASGSANWNELADFNKDGIVNTFDLGIILKNLGQTGASGAWVSSNPAKTATPSGSLNEGNNQGGPSANSGQGYWIWIPK